MIDMNIIIKRGRKNGIQFCKFSHDAVEYDVEHLWMLSNIITGAECCESYRGIFESSQRGAVKQVILCAFKYGHVERSFNFPLIDFEHDNVETIQVLVKGRVKQVKNWIVSVDWEEILEFSV